MSRSGWHWLIITATLALPACTPGDVELNGKLFDAIGVGSDSLSQRQKTPRMAERGSLVMPPSLERLPPPETASTGSNDAAFPVDPERRSSMSTAELQRRHAEYCKEHYDKAVAFGDQAKASTVRGPLGQCAPSAFQMLGTNPLVQR